MTDAARTLRHAFIPSPLTRCCPFVRPSRRLDRKLPNGALRRQLTPSLHTLAAGLRRYGATLYIRAARQDVAFYAAV